MNTSPAFTGTLLSGLPSIRPAHGLIAPVLLLMVVAALITGLLRAGFVSPTAFGWSNGILIDGGWRLFNGQAPHVDFHSPIGFMYLLLVSSAMHLWGATPHALAQTAVLVLPLVAGAAWFLAARRLPPYMAMLTAAFISVHAASIGFLGSSADQALSFSGQYSRIAWSVFFLIPLQSLLDPKRPCSARREQAENLVVGVALGVLFGIKITYFGAALCCIAFARASGPSERRWSGLIAMLTGLVAMVAAGLIASGSTLGSYLADLAMAQRSNATGLTSLITDQLQRTDPLLICLFAAGMIIAWPALSTSPRLGGVIPIPAARSLVLLALGFGISTYNGTEYGTPIYAMAFLVLYAGIAHYRPLGSTVVTATALLAATLSIGLPVLKAGWHGSPTPPASDTLPATPYEEVDFVAGSNASPDFDQLIPYLTRSPHAVLAGAYLLWLREGLVHIERHAPPGAVVATMDVANPFPFALGRQSPRGDVLYWHLDRNVSSETAPSGNEALGEVDVVMVPERPLMGGVNTGKLTIYHEYLITHFVRLPLGTKWWREMWIRRIDPRTGSETTGAAEYL